MQIKEETNKQCLRKHIYLCKHGQNPFHMSPYNMCDQIIL